MRRLHDSVLPSDLDWGGGGSVLSHVFSLNELLTSRIGCGLTDVIVTRQSLGRMLEDRGIKVNAEPCRRIDTVRQSHVGEEMYLITIAPWFIVRVVDSQSMMHLLVTQFAIEGSTILSRMCASDRVFFIANVPAES
jgi:hypothetical protein